MSKSIPMYQISGRYTSGKELLETVAYWQERAAMWRSRVKKWQEYDEPAEVKRCRANVLRCVGNLTRYRRALAYKIQML